MNNIDYVFHRFLSISLKMLFLIPLIGSVLYLLYLKNYNNLLLLVFCFFISIILIVVSNYLLKNDYKNSLIITIILIVAFLIRFLWFDKINAIPISDFKQMFTSAEDFSNGATYMFKNYSYFARFPHMSITVLYFSLIMKVFSAPLIAIRFINVIFSMLNVILIFFISEEIFQSKKKSIWILLISSIYPTMIIYNNVYCSENMAMPLLLLSVLMFFKGMNPNIKNKLLFFSISGLSLSAMHLFRPLGYVMIIAYIMYIFIYLKEKIKLKIIKSSLIIVMFIIPYVIVSYTLMELDITENPLWHPMEPLSVSVLKSTNIESKGAWNQEDYDLVNKYYKDYDNLDKVSKETIKQRLITTPKIKLLCFYTFKYGKQWSSGDFGGIYWSKLEINQAYNSDIIANKYGRAPIKIIDNLQICTQIFHIIILIYSYIGLYKNKEIRNLKIDFFYIMFCGLSLQCLLMEAQDRYTYPFSWIFIILAIAAFDKNNVSSNVNGNGGENGGF